MEHALERLTTNVSVIWGGQVWIVARIVDATSTAPVRTVSEFVTNVRTQQTANSVKSVSLVTMAIQQKVSKIFAMYTHLKTLTVNCSSNKSGVTDRKHALLMPSL